MKKPIELNTNFLPQGNLFKVLSERDRYNNNGIIKYGFIGVFCLRSVFWKSHFLADLDELKAELYYDRVFIINKKTKLKFNEIEPRTLLVINCDIFKKKGKVGLQIPMDLIGICACACTKGLSIVLLMDRCVPKIWNNADFVYKEASIKTLVDFNYVNILKIDGSII